MVSSNSMRIGIDVRLTYYTNGGIAYYIRQLAAHLPPIDPNNEYFVLHSRKDKETLQQKRIDCFTPAHHRLERIALGVELLPHRLHLLHSPDFIPPHGAFRKVITIHDLSFLHYPQFLSAESRHYYNDQIKDAVAQADFILCISESTRVDVINLLRIQSGKTKTIHLAPDPKFRRIPKEDVEAATTRLGIPSEYLLFVGTFEPRKNIDGLIRAYATLPKKSPPLVIAGNKGWMFEDTLKLIDTLEIRDRIYLLQDFSPNDITAIYNAALALVLPSHYEGFGFPVLEAFACGVPVIISNRASLPEIADGAALLCDPDQIESIADAMQKILEDSQLRKSLIEKGFKRAKDFSWEKCAKETLESYQKVLSTH